MEMATGQMYRVLVIGFSAESVIETEYLMVGLNADDIKVKFPYVVDISEFVTYRIEHVIKEPGRVHILKSKIKRATVETSSGTIKQGEHGTVEVIQKADLSQRKFEINAATTLFARDEKHAIKKMSERLIGGSELIKIAVEEVYSGDGFAMPRDNSMYASATFVRG